MRALAAVIGALVLGCMLGLGSAWWAVDRFAGAGEVKVGGWRGNLFTGAPGADPYTRATVAKVALLALARNETVYFMRTVDDAGEALDPACHYVLSGRDPQARWWSVTLYDESLFLARNTNEAHSVDATRVARAPDGGFQVVVGPTPQGQTNWLSTQAAKRFSLTIRLYNPDPAVQESPAAAILPTLVKTSCPEAST